MRFQSEISVFKFLRPSVDGDFNYTTLYTPPKGPGISEREQFVSKFTGKMSRNFYNLFNSETQLI